MARAPICRSPLLRFCCWEIWGQALPRLIREGLMRPGCPVPQRNGLETPNPARMEESAHAHTCTGAHGGVDVKDHLHGTTGSSGQGVPKRPLNPGHPAGPEPRPASPCAPCGLLRPQQGRESRYSHRTAWKILEADQCCFRAGFYLEFQ